MLDDATAAARDDAATPETTNDPWPKPLTPPAFHGLLGAIVRAIEPHTEADPAALLTHVLAMFGNVIGRAPHLLAEGDRHYTNLNVGIVGRTAKGRKGVSRGQAQRIFDAIDEPWGRDHVTSGLSSGEGLIWQVRDPITKQQPIRTGGKVTGYQDVIDDKGVEDKRLLVIESELASTLKVMAREGNTLSPVIRQAWDGQDLRTLTKTNAARATAPHVSLIGHITRDELRRYLDATECANGFGNRFLWVCAKRSKELPDGGGRVALDRFVAPLHAAVQHARACGTLGRTPAATILWRAVYGQLSAGRPGMLGAMTARAEAQFMRLALLYALADLRDVIDRPHVQAALAVWRYCFASARYLFGDRLGDPTADEILRALRAEYPASLTRRDLHDVFGRNRSAAEISRALGLLVECRLVQSDHDHTGSGRPAERWVACSKTDDELNEQSGDEQEEPLRTNEQYEQSG